jgi:hypothetical protein
MTLSYACYGVVSTYLAAKTRKPGYVVLAAFMFNQFFYRFIWGLGGAYDSDEFYTFLPLISLMGATAGYVLAFVKNFCDMSQPRLFKRQYFLLKSLAVDALFLLGFVFFEMNGTFKRPYGGAIGLIGSTLVAMGAQFVLFRTPRKQGPSDDSDLYYPYGVVLNGRDPIKKSDDNRKLHVTMLAIFLLAAEVVYVAVDSTLELDASTLKPFYWALGVHGVSIVLAAAMYPLDIVLSGMAVKSPYTVRNVVRAATGL